MPSVEGGGKERGQHEEMYQGWVDGDNVIFSCNFMTFHLLLMLHICKFAYILKIDKSLKIKTNLILALPQYTRSQKAELLSLCQG